MATRNFVPRANNEGGIGTILKKWATGFINALTVSTINGMTLSGWATSAEIITGTEPAKTIAPDQLRASEATAAEITTGTVVKLITADQAHTSLMKVSGSNLAIGSDANGDMYYRASGVLARLAKSSANLKLFMNAAATVPEWAAGIKMGSFSRDLNIGAGDVAYTGVGFKPSVIIFLSGSDSIYYTEGRDNGTSRRSVALYGTGANSNIISSTTYSLLLTNAGHTVYNTGIIKTFDADGFTITYTVTGSEGISCQVDYVAFR